MSRTDSEEHRTKKKTKFKYFKIFKGNSNLNLRDVVCQIRCSYKVIALLVLTLQDHFVFFCVIYKQNSESEQKKTDYKIDF